MTQPKDFTKHKQNPSHNRTKTATSPQLDGARSSRLLCSNLFFETHRPKHSRDRFIHRKSTKIKQKGAGNTPWGNEATHKATGPGSPLYIRHIDVYTYIHLRGLLIYMYTYSIHIYAYIYLQESSARFARAMAYGIILQDYIMGSYWNHTTGLYYGIILWN